MADAPKYRVELSELSAEIPKGIEMPEIHEEVAQQGYVKIKIHHFSALKEIKKQYLEPFELCGKQWRFLIFPQGNATENLSLYVDHFGPKEGKWATCAQFGVTVYGEAENHFREAHHRFTEEEVDWGFTQFIPKKTFYSEEKGKRYLVDDTMTIGFSLKIFKDPIGTLWHNFVNYDSRAETGFNGLKNQGATCYMNSILQSLFCTNYLRKAVFRMPTDDDDPSKSIPLALQRVFYQLQFTEKPVGTTELTKSFGWDAVDSFMQHDVQEFNRVLCDKLETKMKGTPVEGTINYLLEGKMKSYVKCTGVTFESTREESFYDIQLNVKGLKTLKQSFDDYIQVETLDGDNKYYAEGHGLQEARKGVIFKKFPPVLHLQLKRFEYDMMKDAMVKINDRHEFPDTIDLQPYLENPEQQEPMIYHLHGVLVHSGDLHGGHYCAFLRPEKDGQWLKFDDDKVVKCHAREAMDENFGIDPEADKNKELPKPVSRFSKKFTNAYMLVYVRESDIDKVLCPVEENDLSENVRARFTLEQQAEEQRRKEKEEQHLYMSARVVTFQNAKNYHLTDLCSFDTKTETPATAMTLKVKKDMLFKDFKQLMAEKTGVPPAKQRHWTIAKRQNGTLRPDENLDKFENDTLANIKEILKINTDFRVLMEESSVTGEEGPFFEPYNPANDALLFIKSYDPKRALLQFEFTIMVKLHERPIDLMGKICTRLGKPASHAIKLYEEVRPTMVEKMKPKETFQRLEIGTGDIVCFCDDVAAEELKDLEFPAPGPYYEHILNSISVHFRDRSAPKDITKQFTLQLSKKMNYDALAEKVAKQLETNPLMIRFTSHNHYTEGPKIEFKKVSETLLEEMLQPNTYQPMADILYYEKLDMPITELENKKPVTVSWVTSKMTEEGPFKLLVNKTDNIEHLLEAIKAKIAAKGPTVASPASVASPPAESPAKEGDVEMKDAPPAAADPPAPEPEAHSGQLRLLELFNNRVSRVFAKDDPVKNLTDYSTFYAEEIPVDQVHLGEGDQLVNGFHFHKDPYSSFGIPFIFLLKAGEKWPQTLQRLRKRLNVTEKDSEKYKFAFVSFGKSKYITEDDTVLADTKFGGNDYLGVDHMDKAPRTSGRGERAIVFKN